MRRFASVYLSAGRRCALPVVFSPLPYSLPSPASALGRTCVRSGAAARGLGGLNVAASFAAPPTRACAPPEAPAAWAGSGSVCPRPAGCLAPPSRCASSCRACARTARISASSLARPAGALAAAPCCGAPSVRGPSPGLVPSHLPSHLFDPADEARDPAPQQAASRGVRRCARGLARIGGGLPPPWGGRHVELVVLPEQRLEALHRGRVRAHRAVCGVGLGFRALVPRACAPRVLVLEVRLDPELIGGVAEDVAPGVLAVGREHDVASEVVGVAFELLARAHPAHRGVVDELGPAPFVGACEPGLALAFGLDLARGLAEGLGARRPTPQRGDSREGRQRFARLRALGSGLDQLRPLAFSGLEVALRRGVLERVPELVRDDERHAVAERAVALHRRIADHDLVLLPVVVPGAWVVVG